VKVLLIVLALIASGCTTYGTEISDKQEFWYGSSNHWRPRVFYCKANSQGTKADPICYEAELKDHPDGNGHVGVFK
jgi:hypothetical protein